MVPTGLPEPSPPRVEELDYGEREDDEGEDLTAEEPMEAGVEFRPRLSRYVLGKAVGELVTLGAVGLVFGTVLTSAGYDPTPDRSSPGALPLYCFYGVVVLFVIEKFLREFFRSRENFVIRVSKTTITGPQNWWWGQSLGTLRRTIPFDNLDRARSSRRNLVSRLLGRQYLYSTSGARIYLPRWLFAGADSRRLMGLLGLDRSPTD